MRKLGKTKIGVYDEVQSFGQLRLDPAYDLLEIVHPIIE